MNRATEFALMEQLLELKQARSYFMASAASKAPVDRYTCAARFKAEQARLFRALPLVAAHSNELPNSGDFVTRNISGMPVPLTRNADGKARAFINVCWHRGAMCLSRLHGSG